MHYYIFVKVALNLLKRGLRFFIRRDFGKNEKLNIEFSTERRFYGKIVF